MSKIAFTLSFMLLVFMGFAQEKRIIETVDIITLINGESLKGYIVDESESSYTVRVSGIDYTISRSAVQNISKAVQKSEAPDSKDMTHEFRTNQYIFSGQAGVLTGEDHTGSSIVLKGQYQFNQYVAIGIGLGYDQYRTSGSEGIIPVSIEYTGFINKERIAPFYNLSAGYGFALKDEDNGIVSTDGGYMINPTIGIRIHNNKNSTAVNIYAGYKFQKATYENELFFGGGDGTLMRRYTFKRLSAGVGISF